MWKRPIQPSPVVSRAGYAAISASRELRRMLIPEGQYISPYEVLDYEGTLILHDAKGIRAEIRRRQRVRFLQSGVRAILDHTWGDGVVLTYYDNEAGSLEDHFKDKGRHHLVIGLKRAMDRGDVLEFRVTREAMVGFTKDKEWLETIIDHPVKRLARSIVFPKERPCVYATLQYEGWEIPLPIMTLAKGRTGVRFEIPEAAAGTPYVVRWLW